MRLIPLIREGSQFLKQLINTKEDLSKIEHENDLKLPQALTEWLLFPKSKLWLYKLTNRCVQIPPLDDFNLHKCENVSILTCCVDDIGVVDWGILLNCEANPPVYTKYTDDDPENWYKASPTFSQFIYDAITLRKITTPYDFKNKNDDHQKAD